MVSNYDLTILKNRLDKGFGEIEEFASDANNVLDWIYRRRYSFSRNNEGWSSYINDNWKIIENKMCRAINEIKGYYALKNDVYVDYINYIIIDLLVLWKNSKTRKHKLNWIEDETETTSNKLPRRN